MIKIGNLVRYIKNRDYRLNVNMSRGLCDHWPDEKFIKERFRIKFGYEPDLIHPKTFNEKLQWLKLNDRKPEYTTMVDKAAVKDYVRNIIGDQYLIPTLGVWDRYEDIDFDILPDQFVLKCTHDSHSVVICRDKSKFDKKRTGKWLEKRLKQNYYYKYREWPYKNVHPRILAEPYLEGGKQGITDYKVLMFNGEPKALEVCSTRFSDEGLCIDFYDTHWNRLPFHYEGTPVSSNGVEKPDELETVLNLARKLGKNLIHVRCDFYIAEGRVWFGELTFYRSAGFKRFVPEEWDRIMGDWICLPTDN